eukprot:gene23715-biopygen23850
MKTCPPPRTDHVSDDAFPEPCGDCNGGRGGGGGATATCTDQPGGPCPPLTGMCEYNTSCGQRRVEFG